MWLRFVVHIIFLLDSSGLRKPSLILLDFLMLLEIVECLLVYKLSYKLQRYLCIFPFPVNHSTELCKYCAKQLIHIFCIEINSINKWT